MTEITLKTNKPLISYRELNSNAYRFLRLISFNRENERTYDFALPGTMVMSYRSYCMHDPSFMQVEACADSTVLGISKQGFTA